MASQGESRLPGPSGLKEKRRSFLPAPKTTKSIPTNLPQLGLSSHPSKQPTKSPDVVETKPALHIGQRVVISGIKSGVLKYFGRTHFAEGDWCGIELDEAEGKHDGSIEGVRYFHCTEPYGIFAPIQKVEPHSPTDSTGSDGESKPKLSRLKQPKARGLPQPKTLRTRSASPNQALPLSEEAGKTSKDPSPVEGQLGQKLKFQSHLVKPKAIVKPLSSEKDVKTEVGQGDAEVEASRPVPKPSKLPLQPGKSGLTKKKSTEEKVLEKKEADVKISKLSSLSKKGLTTPPKSNLNETYNIDAEEKGKEDEYDPNFPQVTTPSRVDPHTAFTLAFDLDSSGSDADNKNQLNLTFEVKKQSPAANKPGTLQSPIPDLLTPSAYYGRGDPDDFNPHSEEPEENFDLMTASMISTTSSLGILGEDVLSNDNLLADEICGVGGDYGMDDSKDATEMMEKDIERDPTPEIQDLTGSTISYRTETSSPDSELHKPEFDLTFEAGPVMSSTPADPDIAAGSKPPILETEDGQADEITKPECPDLQQLGAVDITYVVQSNTSAESSDLEDPHGRTFVVRDADRLDESFDDSLSSKAVSDVSEEANQNDDPDKKVAASEVMCTTTIIPDQMNGLISSQEELQLLEKEAIQVAKSFKEESEDVPVVEEEVQKESAVLVEAEMLQVQAPVVPNLQNVYIEKEKPDSIISACSSDAGIMENLQTDIPVSTGIANTVVSADSSDEGIFTEDLPRDKPVSTDSADIVVTGELHSPGKENGEPAALTTDEEPGTDKNEVQDQKEVLIENEEEAQQPQPPTTSEEDEKVLPTQPLTSDQEEAQVDVAHEEVAAEVGGEASGTESQQGDDDIPNISTDDQDESDTFNISSHDIEVEADTTPQDRILEPEDVESEISSPEGLATVQEETEPGDNEDDSILQEKKLSASQKSSPSSTPDKNSPKTPTAEDGDLIGINNNLDVVKEERDNKEMVESMERREALKEILQEGIPSVMSESTAKDAGGEKDSKQEEDDGKDLKDEEPKQEEEEKSDAESMKSEKDVVDGSKIRSDKDIVETKEVTTKSSKDGKNGKVGKGEITKVSSKGTKDVEKTPAKTTKTATLRSKATPKKIDTAEKTETPRKPNTKVGSRLGDYIKSPAVSRTKEENAKNEVNGKINKNALNKKKANMTGDGNIIDKKLLVSPKSENILNKRRASAPVSPVTKIDLNSSSRSMKSVISENEEESPKKPIKRERPKSKWDNIMSKIEQGKTDKKVKPKTETKSRLSLPTGTSGPSPAKSIPSPGTSKPGPSAGKTTPGSRRFSSPAVSDSTPGRSKKTSKVSSPKSSRMTPEPGRLSSRVSSASDLSIGIQDNSRASSVSRHSSKIGAQAKAGSRVPSSIRRDRSPSIGSESQLSSISQVSSQGAKGPTTPRSRAKETTPERKIAAKSVTVRRSLAETKTSRFGSSETESRRSSLAASSRLSTKPKSPQPPATSTPRKPAVSNQGRTKPKSNLKSSAHQPDVIAQSVANANAVAEINRLEALCEARTKELKYAKMQIRSGMAGFEAMAVLVKYLTEELDAFSCPVVTAKLQGLQVQLCQAHSQLEDLRKQKSALEAEVLSLKEQHAAQTEQLKLEHQGALKELEEKLKHEHQEHMQKVEEYHAEDIKSLKAIHEDNVTELKAENEKQLEEKEKEHNESLCQLRKEHENRLTDLQKQHETKLEEITMRFENIKLTLSEKVEFLRNECEELRKREKTYMEACQRDSDLKVQRVKLALAPYKHLPQEIESLKAVMEMKNQEIHDLRRQKAELQKEMEVLPNAQRKVMDLQQKVENLEAIISMKAEYEKQLTEKHQVLLRKYDRESKTNKRLSMDNEELAWRLSQGETGSPDVVRRTLSHSPSNSCASTPEPSRRRRSPRSPHPHSPNPQSPSTPFDFDGQKSNLKRSGTYDLLNQEFDEEEGKEMKQSDV